jgi:RES domain-containing protein
LRVWRITRPDYVSTTLSGEGAARAGNRWNSRGVRVAYTSTSRALAVLEMLVHVNRETVPTDTVLVPIEVPDELIVELKHLPKGWDEYPYRDTARVIGDKWVREKSSAALLVPSAVLKPEQNLLINPGHPDFPKIRIQAPEEKALDRRVFIA